MEIKNSEQIPQKSNDKTKQYTRNHSFQALEHDITDLHTNLLTSEHILQACAPVTDLRTQTYSQGKCIHGKTVGTYRKNSC